MAKVGFIGLGIMGSPMAKNLLEAGHEVQGFDRNPASLQKLREAGGVPVDSIGAAVAGADIVITMLPDSPQVIEVVTGEGGVIENASPNLLVVDMSTIRPDIAQQVAAACREAGLRCLDAPVSGGEAGAVAGTMSIMVGGSRADFDAALPFFNILGGTVVLVGPSGAGQTVKAANQLIVGGIFELVAEAMVYLEAFGVDKEAAIRVLSGGLAGNRILELKGASMLARQFKPGFRIDLHHKDFGIIMNSAREAGVVLPVGAMVAQLMQSARQNGDGGLDHSALLRGVLRLNGLSVD